MREDGGLRVLGAVLAGGASSRFGSPKWKAHLAGRTLGERAVAVLTGLEAVVVVSAEVGLEGLGVEVWEDRAPGQGPLAGILTALAGADLLGLDGVFALACDLPLVTRPLVESTISAWRGEDAVVPLGPGGPEPLCAFYAAGTLPLVAAALDSGERSLQRLLGRLRTAWLPLECAVEVTGCDHPFFNVNTRADLQRAEQLLRERGAPLE